MTRREKLTKNLFRNSSRAQAIVLIAMAFAGLVGIVGLMTDGGMLLVEYARLKRAVDAASLGAAQQYRKDYSPSALTNAATEVLQLNQSDVIPGDTLVQTCSDVPGDPALCTTPLRKLVRVTATRHINFGFLRIFGINSTDITTSAIGEAASVDLVFVIDTSISMASETNYDRNGHSCTWTDSQGSVTLFNCENIDDRAILDRGDNHVIDIGDDPKDCNQGVGGYCQPMADVKSIAQTFADKLFYPYDRVGVVALTGQQTDGSAARNPVSVLDLSPSKASVDSAIENLVVFQPRVCPQPLDGSPYPCLNYPDGINFVGQECPMYRSTSPNDPSSCNSTDAGTGLLEAEAQLTDPAQERTNSFWAVVLLLSGPPNSSLPSAADQAAYPYGYCPPSTWDPSLPFCTQPHIDYTIYPPCWIRVKPDSRLRSTSPR
jgi:hypothetical protein